MIKKKKTVQNWGAWLGLYRKADDMFYWVDDTPLEGQYSAWASKEPNDKAERCVHILLRGSAGKYGKWNDNKCNLSEKDKSKSPVVLCQNK